MKCKYCGQELPDESVFCGFCGKSLILEEVICSKCGNTVPDGMKFCVHCGTAVPAGANTNQSMPQGTPQYETPSEPENIPLESEKRTIPKQTEHKPVQNNTAAQGSQSDALDPDHEAKSKKFRIAVIVCVLVGLCIVGTLPPGTGVGDVLCLLDIAMIVGLITYGIKKKYFKFQTKK